MGRRLLRESEVKVEGRSCGTKREGEGGGERNEGQVESLSVKLWEKEELTWVVCLLEEDFLRIVRDESLASPRAKADFLRLRAGGVAGRRGGGAEEEEVEVDLEGSLMLDILSFRTGFGARTKRREKPRREREGSKREGEGGT